ncbi:MAG TPA: tRNA (guanosine(37)-N1)-methyltransferase TrmD [Actinomycetaceae bacterium]|nr:tRNA (guanosine(37)-N1)-methyltransferase TrmD [Actinomycetaceae bacterium]
MRIDIITIFPEYLAPLELSLIGRAAEAGHLQLALHDLRDWTDDAHRTVDDTPTGGGAGMVMKPDVWGSAIDEVLAAEVSVPDDAHGSAGPRTVLAIPTPSGTRLTQRIVEDLATVDHLVIACGRYEGIDARVAEHYGETGGAGENLETLEYSLGDYVLNGGEVAALALVEAVARLLPGVVGNPESLAEESHGTAGLLEYPGYTRPTKWRELEVPPVLLSGNHAQIERWRRDRALERTVTRRPDMAAALRPEQIDKGDRATLARLGWAVTQTGLRRMRIRRARPRDADALANLAAATFPLACPPELTQRDIAVFISRNLTPRRFREYLTEPERYLVLVGEIDGIDALAGYTLAVIPLTADEEPYADDVAKIVPQRPAAELSKIYVRSEHHSTGMGQALMEATLATLGGIRVEGQPIDVVWLGTNLRNRRSQKFYARSGFANVGARRFLVGGREQDDAVWARSVVETMPGAVAD